MLESNNWSATADIFSFGDEWFDVMNSYKYGDKNYHCAFGMHFELPTEIHITQNYNYEL